MSVTVRDYKGGDYTFPVSSWMTDDKGNLHVGDNVTEPGPVPTTRFRAVATFANDAWHSVRVTEEKGEPASQGDATA